MQNKHYPILSGTCPNFPPSMYSSDPNYSPSGYSTDLTFSLYGIQAETSQFEPLLRDLLFRMYLINIDDTLEFEVQYTRDPFRFKGELDTYFTVEGQLSEEQIATYNESVCARGNIFYNFLEDTTYIKVPDSLMPDIIVKFANHQSSKGPIL